MALEQPVEPRPRNAENLAGGFKPVCDALVQLRVLVDDSPRWLVAEYRQERTKRGVKGFRLEIEPVRES